MPSLLKSEAVILDSIRWKESSKIVTMFSREWGLIKVIARGVYRNKSLFAGKLESLNRVETIINSRQSRSLQILTEADVIDSFNAVRLDLDRLPYAFAILELIRQTIQESHTDTVFYDFIIILLEAIKITKKPAIVFCYFLLKLVSFLGFKPNLNYCQSCQQNPSSENVYFSMDNGTIYCQDCAEGAGITRKLKLKEIESLRILQSYPHRKIAEFEMNTSSIQLLINLMVDYLNYHTENNITVKSLSMLI